MLCGLILAGGMGKRLWPLSTEERPKQFVKMIDGKSLLQNTVNNMVQVMPVSNVFISTTEDYEELVRKELPEIPSKNIIVEPERRDLATSVMLGTLMIKRYFKNPNVLITPCNYIVENNDIFRRLIQSYSEALNVIKNEIITFGVKELEPRAEEIYFTLCNDKFKFNSNNFYRVDNCVVDVNKKEFFRLLDEKKSLIGTGIYLSEAKTIIDLLRRCNKETYEMLKKLEICKESMIRRTLINNYHKTTSNNEALIEELKNICIVPIDVGLKRILIWDDIKNTTLVDLNGNISVGDINQTGGNNNVIIANSTRIKVKNLNGLYVLENNGDIVIGRREELATM